MKTGIGLLDTYIIRAQLVPAVLAAFPALALFAAFISWKDISFSHAIAGTGLLAVLWLFLDRAKRLGKELEPGLFAKMGGMPSTTMLRHSDGAFNKIEKEGFHSFLSRKLAKLAPSPEREAANPQEADDYYKRAGNWLRENTRDTKRFSILFNDNMTYGARRNLLGVKPYALILNGIVVVACIGLLYFFAPLTSIGTTTASISTVLVVAAIHAGSFLRYVNESAVMQAARQYGRQLILSCDTLDTGMAPATPRASRKKA